MNKIAAVLICFAFSQLVPVSAQTKPDNNLTPLSRIYEPKYLKRERADRVARLVASVVNVSVFWEPAVNGFLLNNPAGTPDGLDKAEALLKRFDVPEQAPPERRAEMTVNLIRAYGDAGRAQGSIPPELAPVVKEMKGALPYAGFSLLDTIQVKVEHGLKLEDALPSLAPGVSIPIFYNLTFNTPSVSADGKTVSVVVFHFGVRIPVSTSNGVQYQDEGITTPLNIPEGQKQVLGKLKLSSTSGDDLFVVLSCKVK